MLTAHETLTVLRVLIHHPRCCATARKAGVRSNPINDRDKARAKKKNGHPLRTGSWGRVAQTVVPSPCKLQTGQLAAIEIP